MKTYVKLGNKEYKYNSKTEAYKDWDEKMNILEDASLYDLAEVARDVVIALEEKEKLPIIISGDRVNKLSAFWFENKPVTVECFNHIFQYENAKDAVLSLMDIVNGFDKLGASILCHSEFADYFCRAVEKIMELETHIVIDFIDENLSGNEYELKCENCRFYNKKSKKCETVKMIMTRNFNHVLQCYAV